jgi:hypothetical protein
MTQKYQNLGCNGKINGNISVISENFAENKSVLAFPVAG